MHIHAQLPDISMSGDPILVEGSGTFSCLTSDPDREGDCDCSLKDNWLGEERLRLGEGGGDTIHRVS